MDQHRRGIREPEFATAPRYWREHRSEKRGDRPSRVGQPKQHECPARRDPQGHHDRLGVGAFESQDGDGEAHRHREGGYHPEYWEGFALHQVEQRESSGLDGGHFKETLTPHRKAYHKAGRLPYTHRVVGKPPFLSTTAAPGFKSRRAPKNPHLYWIIAEIPLTRLVRHE